MNHVGILINFLIFCARHLDVMEQLRKLNSQTSTVEASRADTQRRERPHPKITANRNNKQLSFFCLSHLHRNCANLHPIIQRSSVFLLNSCKMNSFEFAYQMKRLSIDSNGSMPSPPDMLPLSMMSSSTADSQEFELDCSQFATLMPPPSLQSSSLHQNSIDRRMSNVSLGSSGFSRSRCVRNLSALGSASSADVSCTPRKIPSYASTPNVGWGYFVDTLSV